MGNRPSGVHPTYWDIYTKLLQIPDAAGRARVAQSVMAKPDLVTTAQMYGVYDWLKTLAEGGGGSTRMATGPRYAPPTTHTTARTTTQTAANYAANHYAIPAPTGQGALVVHSHGVVLSDPRVTAFEREEERRAREYQEKATQRRKEFMRQIATMGDGGKALGILGLRPDYTDEQLRAAYKKRAIASHPDKPGGSERAFDQVTKAMVYLKEELKRRRSAAAGHHDLRQAARTASTYDTPADNEGSGEQRVAFGLLNPKKFNVDMFNQIFEATKIVEEDEEGYEDWFRAEGEDPEEEAPVFSGKFNRDIFNKMFEDHTSKKRDARSQSASTALAFRPPEELQLTDRIGHSELGGGRPKEFTAAFGTGGMQYTDLRAAFTEHNTLDPGHDPRAAARQGRTSLRDYEAEREAVMAAPQTDEERMFEEQRERNEHIREVERVRRLEGRDQRHAALHDSMATGKLLPDQLASFRHMALPAPIHPRSAGALSLPAPIHPRSAAAQLGSHTGPALPSVMDRPNRLAGDISMSLMDRPTSTQDMPAPLRITDRAVYMPNM